MDEEIKLNVLLESEEKQHNSTRQLAIKHHESIFCCMIIKKVPPIQYATDRC